MYQIILDLAPDFLERHAPALLIVVPLMLGGLCAFMPNGRLAWLLTLIASAVSLLCALILLSQVHLTGPVSYHLGGWAPPLGIEFRIDGLNALFLLVITGIGMAAALFSLSTVEVEIRKEKRALFYAAHLICLTGLAGVAITGDAFNLFVFLEISSISTYVLVALGASRDRRALPAAFNYLVMGTIGATFYVIGVGFLYAATGTLNLADMAVRLADLGDNKTVHAAYAFIVVGLGVKAAMWPLHQWLPNAYAYAPSFVTMFLSATATKVAIYALIRMTFGVFAPAGSFDIGQFSYVFAPLAMLAMLICSFQAIFQTDVRRMLAYSSVAQVGYMVLGIAIGTAAGLSAGIFHLVNHAIIKGALFMAVAGVVLTYQGTRIEDFRGLGRAAPFTMTAFAIAGLSLIGMPLTAGFQSKWALLEALVQSGWGVGAVVIVAASLLAVVYMGRVLQAVFFEAPTNPRKIRREAPLLLLVPLWTLALANLWIGVQADWVIGLADMASQTVFGLGNIR